jgi:predicted RNA-binding protein
MNYWLVCLPREDMLHCISLGTFGRGGKQTISGVRSGDSVACLVTKEKPWKIIGIGEATSDYYVDDRNIFKNEKLIVDRFDFKIQHLDNEVTFDNLIPKLKFITQPTYWPVYFKKGIIKLTQEDWNVLNGL